MANAPNESIVQPNARSKRYSWPRVRSALLTGIGIGLAVVGVRTIAGFLPQRAVDNDFALGYVSGRLWRAGADVYSSDLQAYNEAAGLPFVATMGQPTNDPLLLQFYGLLSMLPPYLAFWVVVVVQAVSLLVVFGVAHQMIGQRLSAPAWCAAFGLSICSLPMFAHFWFAQVQLPILALMMLGFLLAMRGQGAVASVVLTLAAGLKLYPLIAVPAPIFLSRGRPRWILVCLIVGVAALWLIMPGLHNWLSFAQQALPYLREFSSGAYFNFTVASFINGLVLVAFEEPSATVARWVSAVGLASTAILVLLAWTSCAVGVRRHGRECAIACFSLLTVSSVMCSVVAWNHYLVFLILPLLTVAADARSASGAKRTVLVAVLVLNLFAANTAGLHLLRDGGGIVHALVTSAPFVGMALLYAYFTWSLLSPDLKRGR